MRLQHYVNIVRREHIRKGIQRGSMSGVEILMALKNGEDTKIILPKHVREHLLAQDEIELVYARRKKDVDVQKGIEQVTGRKDMGELYASLPVYDELFL